MRVTDARPGSQNKPLTSTDRVTRSRLPSWLCGLGSRHPLHGDGLSAGREHVDEWVRRRTQDGPAGAAAELPRLQLARFMKGNQVASAA